MAALTMSNPVPTMEELARHYLEHRRQFGYRLFSQGLALLAFCSICRSDRSRTTNHSDPCFAMGHAATGASDHRCFPIKHYSRLRCFLRYL
jgi:hypothetical protein